MRVSQKPNSQFPCGPNSGTIWEEVQIVGELMNIQITFQNCDSSSVMEKYIKEQLAKITHFLEHERSPIYLEIFVKPGRIHAHHEVDFVLKSPNYALDVHKEGTEIYQVLYDVIDGMYLQLRKMKDKRVEDRKMVGRHEDFKKQR
jgi:ribosomal subunit interface protein